MEVLHIEGMTPGNDESKTGRDAWSSFTEVKSTDGGRSA